MKLMSSGKWNLMSYGSYWRCRLPCENVRN